MRFQALRQRVVTTCIELADRGFVAGTGGNVALRADDEHFVVTASGVDYYTMSASDVCVVRLSDGAQVEGELAASVESEMHARILSSRSDVGASVHTHQPVASAYTLFAKHLDVRDAGRRSRLGRSVPCVGYAPSGTGLLAMRVARAFGSDMRAIMMRNHGVVCVGEDESEAMARVAALESECSAFFLDCARETRRVQDPLIQDVVVAALEAGVAGNGMSATAVREEPRPSSGGSDDAATMSDQTEELLKNDAARLHTRGLFSHPSDSLSVRIPGRDALLFAAPDSTELRTASFEDKGDEVAALHAAIYRARPDAGAILVGRTQWSALLGRIGERIPVLFDEQARRLGTIRKPVAGGRHGRAVDALEGGANIAIFGEQRICIGATPETLVFGAELFEKCAIAFVLVHGTGRRFKHLPGLVRRMYGRRLRRDQKRAAASYAVGRIPDGMTSY
jgi:L-fuculose-phosphate aldolase